LHGAVRALGSLVKARPAIAEAETHCPSKIGKPFGLK